MCVTSLFPDNTLDESDPSLFISSLVTPFDLRQNQVNCVVFIYLKFLETQKGDRPVPRSGYLISYFKSEEQLLKYEIKSPLLGTGLSPF